MQPSKYDCEAFCQLKSHKDYPNATPASRSAAAFPDNVLLLSILELNQDLQKGQGYAFSTPARRIDV